MQFLPRRMQPCYLMRLAWPRRRPSPAEGVTTGMGKRRDMEDEIVCGCLDQTCLRALDGSRSNRCHLRFLARARFELLVVVVVVVCS